MPTKEIFDTSSNTIHPIKKDFKLTQAVFTVYQVKIESSHKRFSKSYICPQKKYLTQSYICLLKKCLTQSTPKKRAFKFTQTVFTVYQVKIESSHKRLSQPYMPTKEILDTSGNTIHPIKRDFAQAVFTKSTQ